MGVGRQIFCKTYCSEKVFSGEMSTLRRVIIATKKAPDAIGPYNQAVQVDSTLYISGQIGFIPSTMQIVEGGAAAEAKQALTNMGHILKYYHQHRRHQHHHEVGILHIHIVESPVFLSQKFNTC